MPKTPRLNLAARSFKVELGTFLRVCAGVNTPRSLACHILAVNGEWEQYLELSFPDTESRTFKDDYLVTEMLRKNPHLPITIDRRACAIEKWHEAEAQCFATNERIKAFLRGDVSPLEKQTLTVINRARDIISSILGPLTRGKLEYAESKMRFGPGSTSSVAGSDVVISKKYTCSMHVTPRLYPYWRALRTASHDVSLRAYSKVTFVAKTSKIDRAIAVEPHMNVYVQLGIGALLRKMLTNFGLNLDHQAEINRARASKAHLSGDCTVDLSSASDTIASELIWLLLPFDWACLLDVARTEYSVLDGKEYRLSKFSSMGNGYTFELESLIFLALARASGDDRAITFGDDIILDRSCFPVLKEALDFLGFSVNAKKTFLAGRFFESCGRDYLDGHLVRPIYLKGKYYDQTSCSIRICNKIRIYSHSCSDGPYCDKRLRSAWLYALRADRFADETYISYGYGNDAVIKNFDECSPPLAQYGHEGFIARIHRLVPQNHFCGNDVGGLAAALHRGTRYSKVSLTGTRKIARATRGNQIVPEWYNLGQWR